MSKINRDFFFNTAALQLFHGSFTQKQRAGLTAILDHWESKYSAKDDRWLAYIFATAHHETGRAMQPIEEVGKGKGRPYGSRLKEAKDSQGNHIPYTDTDQIFYGRGFVQITWYENYQRAGGKLGVNLMNDASKVLDMAIAIEIIFRGMTEGWFTGKQLSDYFSPSVDDWINARRIVNRLDKAELIKSYALTYYACISYKI